MIIIATNVGDSVLISLLSKRASQLEVVKKDAGLGTFFVGGTFSDDYILRIAAEAFIKANKLLFDDTSIDISQLDPDHPLLAMSNEELEDIVEKRDEWGAENYGIAMALLKNKGVSIPDSTLARLQNERIQVLSEKKSFSPLLLLVGYFIAFIPLLHNLYGMHQYIAGPLPLIYFVWYFPRRSRYTYRLDNYQG